ncbi:MAG TPA: hypothetical protein VJ907_00735 [Halanaerobiales bacterium]|nr:hypothetical protein [Halanaerobiales bacterium]
MYKESPVEVSQEEITFKVEELEPFLSAPKLDMADPKPCKIELKDGSTMLIREVKDEEIPMLLEYVKNFMEKGSKDFYDIVGARIYAELLGYLRKRLKDPYLFVGAIDGEIVGFANGRVRDDKVNISLHTMAFKRGLRIGATLYYRKLVYAFEEQKNNEVWSTFESYNGLKRWGIGMAQPSYPYPEYQHELGGARVFYVDQQYWNAAVKDYVGQMVGNDLDFDVEDELLKKNENLVMPEGVNI